MAQLAKL